MIELYNGDCIEEVKKVKDGSVNLVLTDPPYNIARKNNFHTMGRAGIDFGDWDKGLTYSLILQRYPAFYIKMGLL